jgi:putative adenylate-forming enzyme
MNLAGTVLTARAFLKARLRAASWRSRLDVDAFQAKAVHRLLRHAAQSFPYYHAFAGKPLQAWPQIDKAELLANFDRMNVAGVSADFLRAELQAGRDRFGEFVIGQSTGTSGNRGFYIIRDNERFDWLGTLLAKALPDALWRRHRVMIVLPGLPSLYSAAGGGSRIALEMIDPAAGWQACAEAVRQFQPDTLVTSPKVLRWLAEEDALKVRAAFSAAEVLDDVDRAIIQRRLTSPLRQIYMATEGLFAVSCNRGTLHLCEDAVHFEFETEGGLRVPVVTDFTRRAQAMIRYRMNDLLELDETCGCGSPLRAVKRIAGRMDDVLEFMSGAGGEVRVTPDVLRNLIVDSDASITDFRAEQTGPAALRVRVNQDAREGAEAGCRRALEAYANRLGLTLSIETGRGIETPLDAKLRRVQRLWRP